MSSYAIFISIGNKMSTFIRFIQLINKLTIVKDLVNKIVYTSIAQQTPLY